MGLTDKQYNQIARYVDGEMNAVEQKAFETTLAENNELYDEVEFYKEVRLLSESVEQKICNTDPLLSEEKKSDDEAVWKMISQSRKNWENQHEDELKLKYGISPGEVKYIERKDHAKIRTISSSTWLMAAVLTGIICLSVVLWYSQNKEDSKVADNKKEGDSRVVKNNKTNTTENINESDTSQAQSNVPSTEEIAKQDEKKGTQQEKNKIKAGDTQRNYSLDAAKQEALFAGNFKRDDAPSDIPSRSRKAFEAYNSASYGDALSDFDKSEMVLRSFDETQELRTFYARYYRGQIYLVMDSAAKAVENLKAALSVGPDDVWKSKAKWYLALAFLKTGNFKETERLLKQVTKDEEAGEYKQKAIILMKELDKLLTK